MNTGVSSAKSSDLLAGFDTWVGGHRPRIVIISVGMNDALKNAPLQEYRDNVISIVTKVRELGGLPVLQTQNYTSKPDTFNTALGAYFETMREVALETRARPR